MEEFLMKSLEERQVFLWKKFVNPLLYYLWITFCLYIWKQKI